MWKGWRKLAGSGGWIGCTMKRRDGYVAPRRVLDRIHVAPRPSYPRVCDLSVLYGGLLHAVNTGGPEPSHRVVAVVTRHKSRDSDARAIKCPASATSQTVAVRNSNSRASGFRAVAIALERVSIRQAARPGRASRRLLHETLRHQRNAARSPQLRLGAIQQGDGLVMSVVLHQDFGFADPVLKRKRLLGYFRIAPQQDIDGVIRGVSIPPDIGVLYVSI